MDAGSARVESRISGDDLALAGAVTPDAAFALEPVASAARRDLRLRRHLLAADVLAGSFVGALTALVAGLPLAQVPVVAVAVALAWPALASICGLYTVTPLRSWASGVGDAPRLAVTTLLVSWPVYGLLLALGAPRALLGALTAVALLVGIAPQLVLGAADLTFQR